MVLIISYLLVVHQPNQWKPSEAFGNLLALHLYLLDRWLYPSEALVNSLASDLNLLEH